MRKLIIALLALLISGSDIFAAESFVAACRVKLNDQYYKAGTILVLEYPLGKDEFYYSAMIDGKYVPFGKGVASSGEFQVLGGVWSITLAGDTINHLKSLEFKLTTLPEDQNAAWFKDVPVCQIDYSGIRYYESGKWLENKK
jgi:hypothetical protein